MTILMLMLLLVGLGLICGAAAGAFFFGRRLTLERGSASDIQLLTRQAERIELLETELERLKEQADFTEKLLSGRAPPDHETPREAGPD